MKRGTAAKVILGKDTLMVVPDGIVFGTDVILGGKAGLVNDFNGLVLSNNVLLGKKISHSTIISVIVRGQSPLVLPDAIANSLSYVKAFGGTEQRDIPDNYLQRQFIYMLDGSYLLTDIIPESDYKVEMDFQTTTVTTASEYYLGVRDVSGGVEGLSIVKRPTSVDGYLAFDGFQAGSRYMSTYTPTSNTRYKYTYDNGTISLTQAGNVVVSHTFAPDSSVTSSLAINGFNDNGAVLASPTGMYLYSFKVWNAQGDLVADYVPAVEKAAVPVVGFYDTVSGTFKTATAGTFAAGGEAVPTPDYPMDIVSNNGVLKARYSNGVPMGYKNVEYISYLGGAMDTDISGFDDETSEIYFRWKTDTIGVSTNYQSVLFAWESNSYNSWRMLTYLQETDRWYLYGNSRNPVRVSMSENIVHDINIKSGVVTVDGVDYNTTVTEDKTPSSTSLRVGSSGLNNYYYNIKVKRQGQVIADFVPVVRLTDGRAGLYDVVRNFFATASACVAGPDVSVPLEIYTDGTVETIEDTIGNTATAEMLLKVGDFQDEQEILSGAVTRKVGVMVLDGTENWEVVSATNPYFRALTNIPTPGYNIRPVNELCTHCIPKTIGGSTTDQSVCISIRAAGDHFLYLFGRFDNVCVASSANLPVWKQWLASQCLAGTPVIIVYPLATSTTESVAGQTLQVQDGDNTLEITQASLDKLELEAQYNTLVQLTVQEVEDANLDNDVTVTII